MHHGKRWNLQRPGTAWPQEVARHVPELLGLADLPIDHGVTRIVKTLAAGFGNVDIRMGQVGRFRIAYAIDTEFERGAFAEVDVGISEPRLHRDYDCPSSVLHHAEEIQAAGDDGCELRTADYGQ